MRSMIFSLGCFMFLAGCMPTGKACPGCESNGITIKTVSDAGDTLSPLFVRVLEPDSALTRVEIAFGQVYINGPLGPYRVQLGYADGESVELGDIAVRVNPASDCGGKIVQFIKIEKSAALPKGAFKGGYKVVERSSHPGCG